MQTYVLHAHLNLIAEVGSRSRGMSGLTVIVKLLSMYLKTTEEFGRGQGEAHDEARVSVQKEALQRTVVLVQPGSVDLPRIVVPVTLN